MQRSKSLRASCNFILKQMVKLQFNITIDPRWELNSAKDPSCGVVAFSAYCVQVMTVQTKLVLINWKI